MSLRKNIDQCTRCVSKLQSRQLNSGSSNALDAQKMQEKTVILSQWKLVNQLQKYLSEFTPDSKTFENALNKEFAHFLQKIQPSVYGSDLVRYFESFTTATAPPKKVEKNVEETKMETQVQTQAQPQSGLTISDVFNGLRMKTMRTVAVEERKKVEPKWKEDKVLISKDSVTSRTRQILDLLADSKSNGSKIAKIEELTAHIRQYSEAKHCSIKEGAIPLILKTKQRSTNQELKEVANEALALLGYAKSVSGRGIRILSIDGGGVRGILVLEMLKKLQDLTGKPIQEMFDFICGVSTGAIIATLLVIKQKPLDEILDIYKDISAQIFTQSALKGTSNLVWSHSYYDTALWERLLKEAMGDQTLISTSRDSKNPKLCALSAVVNNQRLSAYVFRNYDLPCRVRSHYKGGYEHQVWEAVRASAAAPTYFEEFKLGNMLHQDGGILFNNPAAVAIHEAKLLWGQTPLQCVVSFGTGRTTPNPADPFGHNPSVNSSSWKEKFYAIIESATDTEGVHSTLSDLLPPKVYYRFNPYLTEMLDMSEIDPKKLKQLNRDAVMYLRRNEDKFQEAAKALSAEKSIVQKAKEWARLQGEMRGLTI